MIIWLYIIYNRAFLRMLVNNASAAVQLNLNFAQCTNHLLSFMIIWSTPYIQSSVSPLELKWVMFPMRARSLALPCSSAITYTTAQTLGTHCSTITTHYIKHRTSQGAARRDAPWLTQLPPHSTYVTLQFCFLKNSNWTCALACEAVAKWNVTALF